MRKLVAVPNADELADALMKMASGEITLDDEPAGASAFGETPIEPASGSMVGVDVPADVPVEGARPMRSAMPQRRPPAPPEPLPPPPMPEISDDPLTAQAVAEPGGRSMIAGIGSSAGSLAPDAALLALAREGEVYAPQSSGRAVRQPVYQSDEFRRTLIPVLLVSGILLIVLAISCYCVRPESPLTGLPAWMPPVLFIAGGVLLSLAVLNMLSVRAGRSARGGAATSR